MQRCAFLRIQYIDRTVRRGVEHQIGVGHGLAVYGGQVEERFVGDRHGVRVARAVADVGHPFFDSTPNLSFVVFGSSSAEICRAGIGIV